MGNMTVAATFIFILNIMMWLTQVSALDMNPEGAVFYSPDNEIICQVGDCSSYTLNTSAINQQLPSAEGSISPTTGNLFTDTFSSIKDWLGDKLGLNYARSILSAPYQILQSMGLPLEFVYAIGTLWYGMSLIILVAFIWGRE